MSWTETEEPEYPRMTRGVQALIAMNVAVAFLGATIVQPAELAQTFGFRQGPLADTWWSAFTYMFVHAGLLHLAFNMYTLFLFGPRLEHTWGTRNFAIFYVWCGIGGAIFHALFGGSVMVGASAAIYGVMLAYAMHWPRDEIYVFGVIPMRVATLVAIFIGIDLVRGFTGGDGVAYFAHLGGMAFAFLYLKKPQHVSMEQLRKSVSSAPDVGDDMSPRPAPRSPRSRQRDEVDEIVAQSRAAVAKRPARVTPPKRADAPHDTRAAEMDRVLDKISQHGLDSLTPAEKKLLEERSKELRKE